MASTMRQTCMKSWWLCSTCLVWLLRQCLFLMKSRACRVVRNQAWKSSLFWTHCINPVKRWCLLSVLMAMSGRLLFYPVYHVASKIAWRISWWIWSPSPKIKRWESCAIVLETVLTCSLRQLILIVALFIRVASFVLQLLPGMILIRARRRLKWVMLNQSSQILSAWKLLIKLTR